MKTVFTVAKYKRLEERGVHMDIFNLSNGKDFTAAAMAAINSIKDEGEINDLFRNCIIEYEYK